MELIFNRSKELTLGVELEIQLLSEKSLALAPVSNEILSIIGNKSQSVKHELMLSNIEVNTGICNDVKEVQEDISRTLKILGEAALKNGTCLAIAGTHPFSHWKDQIITEDKRYGRLLDKLAVIAKRFNIFGLHVHVGIDDGQKCIYIMNRMLYYLPFLLAISSNSPFWNGYKTGLKSYRSKVFETLPTAGLPFYLKDWENYTFLVDRYIATGTIETIREIWWDVRPHPDFGTIEVRICDSPSSIKEVMALTAFIQALVAKLGDDYDNGVAFKSSPSWVIRENKWRAARYGLDGAFITEDASQTIQIGQAVRTLISQLQSYAERLNSTRELDYINRIMERGDGASRQLKLFADTGDLKSVAAALSRNFMDEILCFKMIGD